MVDKAVGLRQEPEPDQFLLRNSLLADSCLFEVSVWRRKGRRKRKENINATYMCACVCVFVCMYVAGVCMYIMCMQAREVVCSSELDFRQF